MDNEITDNASNILIHIGARIGKLMEATHRAVSQKVKVEKEFLKVKKIILQKQLMMLKKNPSIKSFDR